VGTQVVVDTNLGLAPASVVEKPFYDPKKSIAAGRAT
jgi:hypothetical protein